MLEAPARNCLNKPEVRMSTEGRDDEATRLEGTTLYGATRLQDHPQRLDEGRQLDQAPIEGMTVDVEFRFAPAEIFPPAEDDDTLAQMRRALEETLGPEFQ